MDKNSVLWQGFVSRTLRYEGGKSSDPDDTAAKCAPYKGAVHTNKGVTFCTFKEKAISLGIKPVTFERFMNLTDYEIGLFLYSFYLGIQGQKFPARIAFSLLEASWMSGQSRAVKTLQKALNNLGEAVVVDGKLGSATFTAMSRHQENEVFKQFWIVRIEFLEQLLATQTYAKYKDGWRARYKSFLEKYGSGVSLSYVSPKQGQVNNDAPQGGFDFPPAAAIIAAFLIYGIYEYL